MNGPDRAWVFWLDAVPRPGWQNMAIDQALLDLAAGEGLACLRLYRWDPSCLSFGRHEPAARRYPRHRVEALGLDCVRRPTGGRAVWHAAELTYAVAAPSWFGTLPQAYRRVHETLRLAVGALGLEATLAPAPRATPTPGAGACFAAAVGGELLAGGRKLAGSAQLRSGEALLQHGSLLLEGDQQVVRDLAGEPPGAPPPEISLTAALGRRVTFEEAAVAARDAARGWPGTWHPADPARFESVAAVHGPRFRSAEWTWSR